MKTYRGLEEQLHTFLTSTSSQLHAPAVLLPTAGLTTPVSSKTPADVAEMGETRNAHNVLA
jgi:hypothetical protein